MARSRNTANLRDNKMFKFIKRYFAKKEFDKLIESLRSQSIVRKTQIDYIDDDTSMYTLEFNNMSGYSVIYGSKTYEVHSVVYIPRNSSSPYHGEGAEFL